MLDDIVPPPLQHLVTSLSIGLLLGLEREQTPSARAGLRTFAIVALLGSLCAALAQQAASPWLLPVGLAAVGAAIVAAYALHPDPDDPGTTTIVALLLCYVLGALAWFGQSQLAVSIAVCVTALLHFKAELRGVATRITRRDWVSMLQFALLSLVILPVLPNRDMGPYGALNPYHIWLMVVLIAGVGLAGYAALRLVKPSQGTLALGVLGGLVSSTATTMVFARRARAEPALLGTATLVILLANLTMLVRVAVLCVLIAPALLQPVAKTLLPGLAAGIAVAAWRWRRVNGHGVSSLPEVGNPVELHAALTFGGIYALVLLATAWLTQAAGAVGLYGVAVVSGLTDVDAITLSSLRLFNMQSQGATPTLVAIALAVGANLCFKAGLAAVAGGRNLARGTMGGLFAVGAGLAAGIALLLLTQA